MVNNAHASCIDLIELFYCRYVCALNVVSHGHYKVIKPNTALSTRTITYSTMIKHLPMQNDLYPMILVCADFHIEWVNCDRYDEREYRFQRCKSLKRIAH